MTYPDDPAANPKQTRAPYPPGFIVAVKPGEVNPNRCEHEATPPVCHCVHDWRIDWGNKPKVAKAQARFVTDAP